MKVFSKDDNIVDLYSLEMKVLGEREGITKVHGWQWGFWQQIKLCRVLYVNNDGSHSGWGYCLTYLDWHWRFAHRIKLLFK